jgi:hypothetical protein
LASRCTLLISLRLYLPEFLLMAEVQKLKSKTSIWSRGR